MTLNYHRIRVAGLEARTSSNSESGHKSIKYGDNNATAGMTMTTSCNRQVNSSNNRSEDMAKNIAQKACKNVVQTDCKTRPFLTPWAQQKLLKEKKHINDYWIVQLSSSKFIMMKPKTVEFERLKKMDNDGNYIFCDNCITIL